MERKQKIKIHRNRRIVICLVLFLLSCAIVPGIHRFFDNSAVSVSRKGSNTSLSYQTVEKKTQDIHSGDLVLVNNKTEYKFPENNRLKSVFNLKNNAYQV